MNGCVKRKHCPHWNPYKSLQTLAKMKDSDGVGRKVAKTLIKRCIFAPWAAYEKGPQIQVLEKFL